MGRFELRREGRRVDATTTELKLLAAFARSRGRVLRREQLLDEVWGSGVFITDRVIDNHVMSLRRKIEDTCRTVLSSQRAGVGLSVRWVKALCQEILIKSVSRPDKILILGA
jgi:DNA-binding response OmpR family regulator